MCIANIFFSALWRLVTFVTDGGYVINPAHFDPAKVMLTLYGQNLNQVLSWKPQTGGQPVRAICMTVGYVFTCNVASPASFGKMHPQTIKSILFGPVRAEWEIPWASLAQCLIGVSCPSAHVACG